MICRKPYNISGGIMIMDVLVAIALASLLVVGAHEMLLGSQDVFVAAQERERLMRIYSQHVGEFDHMVPYESRTVMIAADDHEYSRYSTTTITAYAIWYGNDRVETNVSVFSSISSIRFTHIRMFPLRDISDTAGTSLCSVDVTNPAPVGSYQYYHAHPRNIDSLTTVVTPILLPIDASIPLTDLIVRNGYAYISTDSARQSDPDVLVFDIHDSLHPELLVGLNTGPGISAISLAGNHIFAAVTSRTAQLQSLLLTDVSHISIESSYKLPLPYASATPPLASALFYYSHHVYLGTEKWDGEEFSVVDVSDTAHPTKIGGLEIGSKVNSIYVRGDSAYVAGSDVQQLRSISLKDLYHPTVSNGFSPSGWQRQEGKTISFFEDQLDFGRSAGGFNIKQDHELFGWATSSAPSFFDVPAGSVDVPGGIYGMVRDRSFLYAISRGLGSEFQVFSTELATSTHYQLPTSPRTLTCDGAALYVLSADAPVLYKILIK